MRYIELFTEKTHKWRKTPIEKDYCEKLKKLSEKKYPFLGVDIDQEEFVSDEDWFERSDHIVRKVAQRYRNKLTPIKKDLGIEFTPHYLRHNYISRMVDKYGDAKMVADWVGHESTKMTSEVYDNRTIEDYLEKING